ncbi:Hypothetical protein RG1141_CH23820 [Neorhizobium galegae bv. officinalis bv. officinalis str. HAMBI 1141]|uniref:Uncharacterized protein n=1 Tax=Neorhizobium galegae bv. officinalis bv. officinalis str. HAMBI 1141 TaxID=1028801 RepID=A0A068TBH5_NEOGA|nr:Hypothetical protein RG1141_CH23820 [Neorhizobium galegae bv. officinalis bv. officinalis str. HAMBI 1141]
MAEFDPLRQALINLLRTLQASPEKPVDLYEIGVPLVDQGYTQDEILALLLSLEHERFIGRIENNRLRLVEPLLI